MRNFSIRALPPYPGGFLRFNTHILKGFLLKMTKMSCSRFPGREEQNKELPSPKEVKGLKKLHSRKPFFHHCYLRVNKRYLPSLIFWIWVLTYCTTLLSSYSVGRQLSAVVPTAHFLNLDGICCIVYCFF